MTPDFPALRPNDERARAAVTLLYLSIAANAFCALTGGWLLWLLYRIDGGSNVPGNDHIDLAEQINIIAVIGTVVVLIVSTVTFIRWFRRAYFNLHLLPVRVDHAEGWAAGAWFVPILNLFRPYQIMRELYEKSLYLIRKHELDDGVLKREYLVGVWWGLYVLMGFFDRFSARLTDRAEMVDDMIVAQQVDIASYLFTMGVARAAIYVVEDYARIERILHRPLGSEAHIIQTFGDDL